jgi:hypothetical protein
LAVGVDTARTRAASSRLKPAKKTQLHQLGFDGVSFSQPLHCFFNQQQGFGVSIAGQFQFLQWDSLLIASAFQPGLLACPLNQDAPHRLRCGHEKMIAAVPFLRLTPDEPQPGFVHQGGGLQGVTCRLVCHSGHRQLTEFFINQRQQLIRCLRVSLLDPSENLSHITHD